MRHDSRRSRSRPVSCCALVLAAVLPLACSQTETAKGPPEPAQVSETITATAKVTAIDKAARVVELRNEKGETARIRCGPEVRNFDQLEVGDTVRADYESALAVALMKPDDAAADGSLALGAGRAAAGETPAAGVAAQVTTTVRIESVDTENHMVVFTLPSGRMQVTKVRRPEGREFIRGLKKGDRVKITYTEAVALRLEKQ